MRTKNHRKRSHTPTHSQRPPDEEEAARDRDEAPSTSEPKPEWSVTIGERQYHRHDMLAGKYRLEGKIAQGGMGVVLQATQFPLERNVAIKILAPNAMDEVFKKRFLREASTCAQFSHPNIVTIHDYGETEDGEVFMVMEHLNGASLSQYVRRQGDLPPARAFLVALQICGALQIAHQHGVVHRDLKPSNIMLLPHGESSWLSFVKVLDFGIAKTFGSNKVELTASGTVLGSPTYMAPEQIRDQELDPRTDIYAFGGVLYFMLTGSPPYEGEDVLDVLTHHLETPIPSVRKLNSEASLLTERIIKRCLQKKPGDRYASIDELVADLRTEYEVLTGHPFQSGSHSEPFSLGASTPPRDFSSAALSGKRGVKAWTPSATQPSGQVFQGRKRWLWSLLLIPLLIGAVWLFTSRKSAVPVTPIEATPPPSTKRIVIKTEPPGLALEGETGVLLGTAPVVIDRPPSDEPLWVRAVKGDQKSHQVRVPIRAEDEEVVLTFEAWIKSLQPPPKEPPKEVAPVTPPPKRRVSRRRKPPPKARVSPKPVEKPAEKPVVAPPPRPAIHALDEEEVPAIGTLDESEAPEVGQIDE